MKLCKCKRQFILLKKSKVRAYNGNKGNTEVIIENPYESKIPTRYLLGMIDADSYIGNWGKKSFKFPTL